MTGQAPSPIHSVRISQGPAWCPGGGVLDLGCPGGYRWGYCSLDWHEQAENGLDLWGCRVWAVLVGDQLLCGHGDDPEAFRWFTLDALNKVGGCWQDPGPVSAWHAEIHAQLGRRGALRRHTD